MSTAEASRKFHFIREIASGGFGSVYLAKVIHGDGFSRLCAIKLLHPKWSENEEIASRMRDEARLLGWLRHKNIVDVMDLTMIDGRCAVIMEYLEAVDIKVVLGACIAQDFLMPLRGALEVCAAVASALDAAYNRPPYAGEKPLRVVHRDIKPSNIMLDDAGVVKVLDFGVARAEFDQREAHTQEMAFGSLEYMPPERLFFEPESAASDVYSLGVTLYEMLALEKFGKAKLRPEEHERHIRDRFEALFESHPMPSEDVEDEVWDLMSEMVAFDEGDRPAAADINSRMRALARRLPQAGLEEWCELVVPPLVKAAQHAGPKDHTNSMVDKVLSEDSKGFERQSELMEDPDFDDDTADSMVVRLAEITEEVEESELDATGYLDEQRWSAFKRATIEELTEEGQLGPVVPPPTPPPAPTNLRSVSVTPRMPVDEETTQVNAPVYTAPPPPMTAHPAQMTPVPSAQAVAPIAVEASAAVVELETVSGAAPAPRSLMGTLAIVGVLLLGVGMVVAGVLTLGVGGGALIMVSQTPTPEGVPTPTPTPEIEPKRPAPEPVVPVAPPEGSAVFVSKLANTKKIQVRCDKGKGEGKQQAFVPAAGAGTCTVIAVYDKRSRATARVKDVKAKTYVCFEGSSKACEPG